MNLVMLLSLVPSSCIVAPNREIVNSNISFSTLAMSNLLESKAVSENIQMGTPRGRATVSSMNLSRELSMLSKASSIEYLTCIEAQSTDLN